MSSLRPGSAAGERNGQGDSPPRSSRSGNGFYSREYVEELQRMQQREREDYQVRLDKMERDQERVKQSLLT